MLVKKLKVITAGFGATETPDEVKYLLTADIAEMAELIGVPADWLANQLMFDTRSDGPFYGNAEPEAFFLQNPNGPARTLSLKNVHVRVTERARLDASGSFLIVPLVVTNPEIVGDLTKDGGSTYQLIPHIRATFDGSGTYATRSVFRNFDYLKRVDGGWVSVLSDGISIGHELVGFDLLLWPKPESPEHRLGDLLKDYVETPSTPVETVPTERWIEINPLLMTRRGALIAKVFTHSEHHRFRYELINSLNGEVLYSVEAPETLGYVSLDNLYDAALLHYANAITPARVASLKTLGARN